MAAERRFEPWPYALAAALAAMIGTSLSFYAIAARHPDALVVEDAYAAGLEYNARIRDEARVRALGVSVAVTATLAEAKGGRGASVQVRTDGGERGLTPERVEVRRMRPAEGGLDASFALQAGSDGYTGFVPLPRPGRWQLAVESWVDGTPVRETLQLEVP